MLQIEDIKVADLNKGEEPLPNENKTSLNGLVDAIKEADKEKNPPKYGDYISLVQQVNAAVYEIKSVSKELHEISKNLKLIAGRIR